MEQQNIQKKSALVKRINTSPKSKPKTDTSKSKLDALLGNHTKSVIVALLFIVTLIAYVIVICVKDKVPDTMANGFQGMLILLGGVFGGNQLRK